MPFPISCTARSPLPRRRLLPAQEAKVLRQLEQTMREEGAGEPQYGEHFGVLPYCKQSGGNTEDHE